MAEASMPVNFPDSITKLAKIRLETIESDRVHHVHHGNHGLCHRFTVGFLGLTPIEFSHLGSKTAGDDQCGGFSDLEFYV